MSPQMVWDLATWLLHSSFKGTYWLHRTTAFVGVMVRERTGLVLAWIAVAPDRSDRDVENETVFSP